MPSDSVKTAQDDIVITPEMIEAGARVIRRAETKFTSEKMWAEIVFLEMWLASKGLPSRLGRNGTSGYY
jgi:hypothetical protein